MLAAEGLPHAGSSLFGLLHRALPGGLNPDYFSVPQVAAGGPVTIRAQWHPHAAVAALRSSPCPLWLPSSRKPRHTLLCLPRPRPCAQVLDAQSADGAQVVAQMLQRGSSDVVSRDGGGGGGGSKPVLYAKHMAKQKVGIDNAIFRAEGAKHMVRRVCGGRRTFEGVECVLPPRALQHYGFG